ncbi:MAG: DASS family sodium-coupled anion symporter [Deltaproteobacteria bacterium]|nr:DASS family sodium-coupled anion symporter [bacterium]MCB9475745.1 DASS family sodium-coupled anion symporter [Deltaproteobacteria bacterium]MCB9490359.1 DASS family sodium-coupled anion symporter [Deltaproteobacteria bacterium]
MRVWNPEAATQPAHSPLFVRYHFFFILLFTTIATAVAFSPTPEGLTIQGQRAIGIFTLCVSFWVTAVIPLQITSIIAIIMLPMLGIMDSDQAFALFGNKAVFFILGAFIISAVIVDSGLSSRATYFVLSRFAFSARALRTAIIIFAAFSSCWMSEHAVAAMLFPIVMSIVKALGLKPFQDRFGMSFFFAMAWGCVIGGITTYLGGARNLLAVGILHEQTGVTISFVDWAKASTPLVGVLLTFALAFLHFGYPATDVNMKAVSESLKHKSDSLGPFTRREKGVAIVTLVTIFCWVVFHDIVGLATMALASVAMLFILRLTEWDTVEQSVNWGVILMYGGAIALGSALSSTGAAEWVVDKTFGAADLSSFTLIVMLGAMSLILTEFISNAAVVSVLMPVALGLAHTRGISPQLMAFTIALPSGLSYVLPMGTPATAIAYSSGYMTQKDFMSAGPVMAMVSLITFALVAKYYWPLIGYSM